MKTLMAKFDPGTSLLVQGVKGKISNSGEITDRQLMADLEVFIGNYHSLFIHESNPQNIHQAGQIETPRTVSKNNELLNP